MHFGLFYCCGGMLTVEIGGSPNSHQSLWESVGTEGRVSTRQCIKVSQSLPWPARIIDDDADG